MGTHNNSPVDTLSVLAKQAKTVKDMDGFLRELDMGLTDEKFYALTSPLLAEKARKLPVSVEGFCAWYEVKFKRPVPPVVEFIWCPEYVEAFTNHTGVLVEGHRGSGKSTFLITWVEYLIGKRPVGSSQLIRINSQQAGEADEGISSTIEHNPAWRMCFPNVVPDFKKGWSITGRFVKDLDVCGEDDAEYGTWSALCTSDHLAEPSFLCSGITSRDFIGKHPSNGQYYDDLHDEGNTRSAREMQEIVDIIEKNIVPTWTRPDSRPVLGVACTLWSPRDGYHALLRTGLFKHIKTPIYVLADNPTIQVGDKRVEPKWIAKHPIADIDGQRVIPLWLKYGEDYIRQLKRQNPVYFGLMYLCDLQSVQGKVLKEEWLHEFPVEKLMPTFPVYFGIDFASTEDKIREKERDYFALAVLAALPWGGSVLIDGFREHLGFFEAVERVKLFAAQYPTLVTIGVEKWGTGEKFTQALLYSSNLPIVQFPFEGSVVRSKGQRYQAELAPMFVDGRLWVTDVKRPFHEHFKQEWITWDGGKTSTGHDDCLDAVYTACGVAQAHLMPRPAQTSFSQQQKYTGLRSAWSSIGKG
jgi:hypothetical protein